MKRLEKMAILLLIILIILILPLNIFGAELKTALNVIQPSSETKYLENDQGYISKAIVDSNKDTGEVTIELKLSNTKKDSEIAEVYEDTEIYLMVSENIVNDDEKLLKYTNNIQSLASKIFETNSNTKIGIIGITGTIRDGTKDEDGNMIWGENDEGDVNGSESNAEIVVKPTDNINTIINSLQNMNLSKNKYYTNLQAAIRLANKSYSSNVNKILISLYDNVPDLAIGVCKNTSYGGMTGLTAEEAVKAKHEKIATYTRDEILTLKTSNVSFILLRPDDTSYDETWYSTTTGKKTLEFDGSPYVKTLYGTVDNPTYGKMYTFDDDSIDTIITENIYQDIEDLIQQDIYNIKIVDYFPEDITNNFEFSYVGSPSIGTVSNVISSDNTIEWDIDSLKGNAFATLRYKLKIKDMKNQNLLNKTISTNQKVTLTYKDVNSKEYSVTLTSSPTIQLAEVKENTSNVDNASATDNTTMPKGRLPQTGANYLAIAGLIIAVTIAIITFVKIRSYKNIK